MQPDVTQTHQQQYINIKRSKDETINNSIRNCSPTFLGSRDCGWRRGGRGLGGWWGRDGYCRTNKHMRM